MPSTQFFFNDTATTEIYTLSLHDALPICRPGRRGCLRELLECTEVAFRRQRTGDVDLDRFGLRPISQARDSHATADRKSTRLNSSHANISYAVFCLK